MGVLVRGKLRQTLGSRSLIGRAEYCAVRLDDPFASGEHASLLFDGGRWVVRDLASTNGTYLNGIRIESGRRTLLAVGDSLGFGSSQHPFLLECARPPRVRFRELGSERVHEPDGALLVLPSELRPLVTLYGNAEGWFEDRDGTITRIIDQQHLLVDGTTWVAELPPLGTEVAETGLDTTARFATFESLELELRVSSDRECIEIVVVAGHEQRTLASRAHHETLLVLAEARLNDRGRSVAESEAGWLFVEELARRTAADPTRINVDVFRARQQFDQLGVLEAHRIVERRGAPRKLRIGVETLSICYDWPRS